MNKQLVLPIYIVVEVIYYIGYSTLGMKEGSSDELIHVGLPFYIICGLVNTYFVAYGILPDYLKRSMKRKNIGLKILFYFVLAIIGFMITNGPVEFLIEGSV